MPKSEPVAVALLFCDYLITEKHSSKKTLAGVFSVIWGKKFPLQFKPFWVYASFTNLLEEHPIAINIASDKTQNVVMSLGGNINSKSNDAVIELCLPVPMIMLPEPGGYGVTLHIDGKVVLNRTLYVKELPKD